MSATAACIAAMAASNAAMAATRHQLEDDDDDLPIIVSVVSMKSSLTEKLIIAGIIVLAVAGTILTICIGKGTIRLADFKFW